MNDLHPDAALLRAYAVGDLPDERAQQLEQHLADCPDCEQTIDNLSAGDETLISGLRQPRPDDPVLAEPQLTSALGRIAAMVQAPGQAAAESALESRDKRQEQDGDRGSSGSQLLTLDSRPSIRLEAYPTVGDLGQLGVYRLLSRLGEGGMGTVYKALHTKLKRTVALKVLPAERLRDPHAVARFEREMEAVGRLEHPNIVRAMDAGEADGKHFLVMEYVEGCDLAELSRRLGPLPVADACELIRQAADGLEFAHQRGLVHRDIKPANIMVESRGSRGESGKTTAQSTSPPSTLNSQLLVKILDLGLARLSNLHDGDDPTGHHVTGTGQIMGTIDYMAPEQAADSHSVDIRADIYSLGATLYKLLTGHSPYHGQSYRTTLQKLNALANQPIPPIQSRRSDVPDELAALVHRLLDKDANQRPATPAEVAAALAPFTTTASLADLASRAHVDPSAPTADPATTGTHASVKSASVDTLPHDHQSGVSDAVPASPSKLSPTIDLQRPPEQPSASVRQAFQPDEGGQPGKADVRRRVFLTAAAAGGILLLAALVFFVRTKDGVIRVEIDDPAIEVAIQGTDITLKQADQGKDVKLSPGEKTLLVSRDGLQFETDKLILKRGETVTVRVELLAGEIHVRQGDTIIGRQPLPGPATPGPVVASNPSRGDSSDPNELAANAWQLGSEDNVLPGLVPRPAKFEGIKRWQAETMIPRGPTTALAVSPDGKLVACGQSNGEIRIYDAKTLQLKRLLLGHDLSIRVLKWSADGQLLASGGDDRVLRIWDDEGRLRHALGGYGNTITGLSWSADGRQIASSSEDAILRRWNLADEKATTLVQADTWLYDVDWNEAAGVFTAGGDGTIRMWNEDGTEKASFPAVPKHACTRVAWNPTKELFAASGYSGNVYLLKSDGTQVAELRQPTSDIPRIAFSLRWSADGERLLIGWYDEIVQIVDSSGTEVAHWQVPTREPGGYHIEFVADWLPDAKGVVVAGQDVPIATWDLSGKQLQALPSLDALDVRAVAIRDC